MNPEQTFQIVLAQLYQNYFLEHLPVVDYVFVVYSKKRNIDVIQHVSCELQSLWFPLGFFCDGGLDN